MASSISYRKGMSSLQCQNVLREWPEILVFPQVLLKNEFLNFPFFNSSSKSHHPYGFLFPLTLWQESLDFRLFNISLGTKEFLRAIQGSGSIPPLNVLHSGIVKSYTHEARRVRLSIKIITSSIFYYKT